MNELLAGIDVINVFGKPNPELYRKVINFWRANGAVTDPNEAEKRVRQLVQIALKDERVIGVSTIYTGTLPQHKIPTEDNNPYCFFRMFIQDGDRNLALASALVRDSYEIINKQVSPDQFKGMIIITDNVKVCRPSMQRYMKFLGYEKYIVVHEELMVYRRVFSN